jgi:hypothetical protein
MPAFWGVVRSLPKREVFAAERLRMDHGFEVFLPLVQTRRASQPLFRGYFFCRIVDLLEGGRVELRVEKPQLL